MDERKLTELLNDAVADVPPPTFDQGDVAKESDRQRIRRRNGVLTGSAFGVAILAGATALSMALWTGDNSAEQAGAADVASAPGNGNAAPYELPQEEDAGSAEAEGGDQNSSPESRKQGRSSDEDAGAAGPGSTSSGCEQADRELAAALAGELPAAANLQADDAICAQDNHPGAAFRVDGGTISAMMFEPGSLASFGDEPGWEYEQAEATTDDDRTVVILSGAKGAPPPYADRLDEWAAAVALKY